MLYIIRDDIRAYNIMFEIKISFELTMGLLCTVCFFLVATFLMREIMSCRTIHIIHRIDRCNTGDMVSSCSNYFYFPNFRKKIKHDIYKVNIAKIKKHDIVIFSGGGLLDNNDGWNKTINDVLARCTNCYAWGVGLNLHTNRTINSNIEYKKFKGIGIRDYNCGLPYLPCSSCMIPQLRKKYTIKRQYGVLEHINHPIDLDLPKMKNNEDIMEIIKFIGESMHIITNTYHCLYFSMPMGKKVILYESFSSKFHSLRYPQVMYSGDMKKDFDRCKVYPEFYKECIRLNKKFYLNFQVERIITNLLGPQY